MAITNLPFLCLCVMPLTAWLAMLAAIVWSGE
jgi:hypothetical protein